MVDILAAIKRPFLDMKKLSLGAIFYMIPFVNLMTQFFSRGYGIECGRTALKHKLNKLPSWDNIGELFVNGLLMSLISIIYFLPVIFLGFVLLGKLFTTFSFILLKNDINIETLKPLIVSSARTGLGFSFLIFLVFLTAYILPMAYIAFAKKGRLADAFQLDIILKKCFTFKYLCVWILIMAYSLLVISIASLLSVLSSFTVIFPIIFSGFAQMIIVITQMTAFGELYSEKI